MPETLLRERVQRVEVGRLDLRRALGPDEPQRVFELAPPVGVARALVAVRDRRVDDDERGLRRHRHEPELERPAVEQDRLALAAEHRSGLVEDPARHADGAQLGPLAGERECERLELEPGDRAQREGDRHLERRGRREPGAGRQIGAHGSGEADRRPAEQVELDRDRLGVPRPALSSEGRRRRPRTAAAEPACSDESEISVPSAWTSTETPYWIATGRTSPPL